MSSLKIICTEKINKFDTHRYKFNKSKKIRQMSSGTAFRWFAAGLAAGSTGFMGFYLGQKGHSGTDMEGRGLFWPGFSSEVKVTDAGPIRHEEEKRIKWDANWD